MINSQLPILIIEPHSDGHHMQYVRYAASSMINNGVKILLATLPASSDNPAYKEMQEACDNRIELLVLNGTISKKWYPGPIGTLVRHFEYYKLFRDFWITSIEAQKSRVIFIPYLDYCDKVFSIFGSPFGSTPWGGLLMRPSFHYQNMGIIAPSSSLDIPERFLLKRLLQSKRLLSLFTIDEPLSLYTHKYWPHLSAKMKYVMDPADLDSPIPREDARRLCGLSNHMRIMLIYGSLTLRKGVDILLEATRHPDYPSDLTLYFAGKQDEDVRELLSRDACRDLRRDGKLIETDRYLSRAEQTAAFCASDIVWLGYRNHLSSSGVLAQAQSLNLPIIGCQEGVIGWTLSKYNNGYILKDKSVTCVVKAIRECLNHESQEEHRIFNDRFSIDRFGSDILTGLQ